MKRTIKRCHCEEPKATCSFLLRAKSRLRRLRYAYACGRYRNDKTRAACLCFYGTLTCPLLGEGVSRRLTGVGNGSCSSAPQPPSGAFAPAVRVAAKPSRFASLAPRLAAAQLRGRFFRHWRRSLAAPTGEAKGRLHNLQVMKPSKHCHFDNARGCLAGRNLRKLIPAAP